MPDESTEPTALELAREILELAEGDDTNMMLYIFNRAVPLARRVVEDGTITIPPPTDEAIRQTIAIVDIHRQIDETVAANPEIFREPIDPKEDKPIWKLINEISDGIPASEWEKIPADFSERIDHACMAGAYYAPENVAKIAEGTLAHHSPEDPREHYFLEPGALAELRRKAAAWDAHEATNAAKVPRP